MEYKFIKDLQGNTTTIRLTTEDEQIMFIPLDESNTDYQEYLKWVEDGGVPEEADNN